MCEGRGCTHTPQTYSYNLHMQRWEFGCPLSIYSSICIIYLSICHFSIIYLSSLLCILRKGIDTVLGSAFSYVQWEKWYLIAWWYGLDVNIWECGSTVGLFNLVTCISGTAELGDRYRWHSEGKKNNGTKKD